ncbi:transporter substrate-binding domain-containing protein [Pseudomonas violetae]|jgi:polar amino acid transport system substrate-binding protein|uniref:Transporter substrate-binding domain-containing protein n=1 Tax=Pseudomonas violetae TaxID=2915813 RepID=A0ABT0EXU1_9PSED|nr:transporter substrate-binding domain-containing protein [Pseudomonas violetae]MCK1790271.1 transporter substrate-binding domain-containing protein [Pseudomonas violetae]
MKLKHNAPTKNTVLSLAGRFMAAGAASIILSVSMGMFSASQAATLEEVKAKGVLNIATEDSYYPFEFIKDGESDGFHKDVIAELRKYAKFQVKQDIMPWTGLLAGITSGKYDGAITGAGVTEERLGAFDFVAPVAPEVSHYIKRANDDRIKDLSSLSGLTVGVQAGGAQLARLTQLDAKLKTMGGSLGKIVQYQSYPEAYADLANGRLDYVVNSIVPANMLVKERPKVFAVGEATSGKGFIAWPVAKGNKELLEYLTGFVNHLRDTGKLLELQKKWLGQSFDDLPHESISSLERFRKLTEQ